MITYLKNNPETFSPFYVILLSDFLYLSVYLLKAKQSLATLTKDVPKRHSLAMPTETVVNGNNQEWVMHADLPLTAAIRQSQQTLYVHTGHPTDRQGRKDRSTPTVTHKVVLPSFSLCMIMRTCFTHTHSCHLLSTTILLATDVAAVITFHALYVAVTVNISFALQLPFVFATHKGFRCI